ncbi:hypothetical protein ACJX0J_037441 [Zea mays]
MSSIERGTKGQRRQSIPTLTQGKRNRACLVQVLDSEKVNLLKFSLFISLDKKCAFETDFVLFSHNFDKSQILEYNNNYLITKLMLSSHFPFFSFLPSISEGLLHVIHVKSHNHSLSYNI